MNEKHPAVRMQTTMGDIILDLDAEKAPVTVENFLGYVADGFFDGTIFHRVIKDFMIQGGGFTPTMGEKKTKLSIKNEAGNGLKNGKGTIAMARTQVVDSATSQFFINVADNDFLDHRDKTPNGFGYAVFGKVREGLEVVEAISKVATGNSGFHQDVPRQPVIIEKVTLVE
ncbi:MAG: peptidyl-prolyl cis-trans isomerase [Candidatus Tectomicrobia bacterium]|uniref:Peptidyl-prolyl cis-trans isomerase n=1 Tax=Tectimicrobiota bacterium TaxID=2528274 RepID=A0A932M1I2_UNCTE|nr:peptidyl-prolyl cis-trans isomerase [Candidatus Tectomicrobia bacterium]